MSTHRTNTLRLGLAAGLAVGLVLGAAAPAATAQPVTDREKLVDVDKLREAMDKATQPIAQRIRASTLRDAFGRVNETLRQDRVDKAELIGNLRSLRDEIGVFTTDWDAQVADPLWDAQEEVAGTIDRVRGMLAQGASGEPTEQTRRQLEGYDRRLQQLALAIQEEKDDLRRERLKVVFANIRSLRDVVEKTGSIDLSDAREAIYVKTIRALAALEAQLTNATFEVERVRLVLSGERAFIENYVALLEGLVEAESLAKMLGTIDGEGGLASLAGGLGELSLEMETLGEEMDVFVEALAESIEVEAERVGARLEARTVAKIDVDAEVARYAEMARSPAPDSATPKPAPTPAGSEGGSR